MQTETTKRREDALMRALGPELIKPLEDPAVIEILLNPDGKLWVERLGGHELEHAANIDRVRAMSIISTVAGMLETTVTLENPILECELPTDGSRFEALIPPVVSAPTFSIRKKASAVYTLDQYIASGIMTEHQREAILTAVSERKNILVAGGTGCHEADAPILMYDGSTKRAADVCVGDELMGPDSKPRTVLALHHGIDEMARIKPIKGEPIVVNTGHIMSLVSTPRNHGAPRYVVNIPVKEWVKKSQKFKHLHKMRRVAVEFPEKKLPIDPYFIGLLIGDGVLSGGSVGIAKPDPEVLERIEMEAAVRGLHVSSVGKGTSIQHRICCTSRGLHSKNSLIGDVKSVGLFGTTSANKFIPQDYKTSSRQQRLELLAGLMDSDGSWSTGGYDYITKSRELARDVQFLCRSLGFSAQIQETTKSCTSVRANGEKHKHTGTYYRIFVSGNCDEIPCRIPRKKATARRQKKNHLVCGFNVEGVGVGCYFGFEVDKDHLYLDGQFFVHHNTGKTTLSNAILHALAEREPEHRVVIIEDTRELQCQAPNTVYLRTSDTVDQTMLLRATMRLRPDRIVVGEVRDKSALALLKAWNTGHPGGVGTVHANDAAAALVRVGQLVQEAGVPPAPDLIAEAVNVVVSIKRDRGARRIEEVVTVSGYDAGTGFRVEKIA